MDARSVSVERRWDALIQPLAKAVDSGETGLEGVPFWIKEVLDSGAWREFDIGQPEPVRHEFFDQFVTAKPRRGLGTTIDIIERLVADDKKARGLLTEAMRRPVGTNQYGPPGHRTEQEGEPDDEKGEPDEQEGGNNIPSPRRPEGTSPEKALRRLRKDRPDLLKRVVDGELSPHAAAIEAGFRPRTISVPVDHPDRLAAALVKHLKPDVLAEVSELILKEI